MRIFLSGSLRASQTSHLHHACISAHNPFKSTSRSFSVTKPNPSNPSISERVAVLETRAKNLNHRITNDKHTELFIFGFGLISATATAYFSFNLMNARIKDLTKAQDRLEIKTIKIPENHESVWFSCFGLSIVRNYHPKPNSENES